MSEPAKLGKYEVQGVLGKGAMGVVYKAIDPHIERTVAIKTVRKDLLDADLAAQFLARFRNEARAAGRLAHPNIIGIYEYGEDDAVAYIAMEYVDGTGLREYLNRKARFELHQIVAIVSQLLLALEFAHAQRVVHRDVKPANLILTSAGALKVADFGIARIDQTNLTMTGMVMGTPSYMAPEQCRGLPSDHRGDLFSAGVVLYELLAGRKPFDGTIETVTYKICHEDPPPPSTLSPLAMPAGLDGVVAMALAKDPALRYSSARAFHSALIAAVRGAVAPGSETTLINLSDVPMQPAGARTLDDASLATAERQLVRFVGPMARIFVRQAAAQAHDTRELYALLAAHIDDPRERARFESHQPPLAPPASVAGTASAGARATRAQAPTTGTRAKPPRPLDQAFVDQTTSRLAVYLGPIARIVARNAAQRARDGDEFIALVAEHIGTQERDAFLREFGER
ncbi:MAG: serine/threonine-protein kinase [Betaproteobacteria bacterium]|jgi:serine/threonine-protein kinase